jgi:hypothetical protein
LSLPPDRYGLSVNKGSLAKLEQLLGEGSVRIAKRDES